MVDVPRKNSIERNLVPGRNIQ